MGTYLSTPVLDKCQESGCDLEDEISPVSWGVVDMQGWRKSMEDAHVAKTNLPLPPLYDHPNCKASSSSENDNDPALEQQRENGGCASKGNTKVFGVFDGHGGPEVARFCQLYLVEVLLSRKNWNGDSAEGKEHVLDVGKALIDTFHSLDRMIDDEERRTELGRLRLDKPSPGETRTIDWPIPPTKQIFITSSDDGYSDDDNEKNDDSPSTAPQSTDDNDDVNPASTEKKDNDDIVATSDDSDEDEDGIAATNNDDEKERNGEEATTPNKIDTNDSNAAAVISTGKDAEEEKNTEDNKSAEKGETGDDSIVENDSDGEKKNGDAINDNEDTDDIGEPNEKINDDSDDDSGEEENEGSVLNTNSADAMSLFHRLLKMQGAGAEDDEGDSEKDSTVQEEETSAGESTQRSNNNRAPPSAYDNNDSSPCASNPTKILNGRQVCNLPDHPIHAGCTAVVAVIIERTVYVANAGDSRAVLCRKDGITQPLSFDHKPLHDIEMNRIKKSGGFVNQFGRVNGNLNLSRSIGDLKYKQVPGFKPSEQMITAEPDIIQATLNPEDEFIILGCDGIWDCLSNEQAVQYVRSRIDTKTPTEIGIEMLDEIISDDPRVTQGIGGDNMTIMIIDLLPHTRSLMKNKSDLEDDNDDDDKSQ
uniref:protein-serine/threonine phosphatase n=2 Tax=Ditylum brightwellii TaxID=49249 RepID=A0A7S4VHE5_9STRA|mmetsp:Transcript_34191/g.45292  ORF Transcript_34191/g.45292 Transcript_34191/m.45292 type:complete len:647 (+) Transcript_34191:176-2116(+)